MTFRVKILTKVKLLKKVEKCHIKGGNTSIIIVPDDNVM